MIEPPGDPLFGWTHGDVVLIGERRDHHWVLSRGWRQADRLTGVRRWEFRDARAFVGQVRRLARDATANETAADAAANDARAWVDAISAAG